MKPYNTLYQLLKNEMHTISITDLNQIVDEELTKEPDEIDTELVEFCLTLIKKYHLSSHEHQSETDISDSPEKIQESEKLLPSLYAQEACESQ